MSGGRYSLAQITIADTSLSGTGTRIEGLDSGRIIDVNVGASGANQIWDVSMYDCTFPYAYEFLAPTSTPNASLFPTATHCARLTNENGGFQDEYFQLADSSYLTLGFATFFLQGNPSVYRFDTLGTAYPLPLNYEMSWTSVDQFSDSNFIYTYRDSIVSYVDGWGRIFTSNSEYQVLRIVSHSWNMSWPPGGQIHTALGTRYIWVDSHGNTICWMWSSGLLMELNEAYVQIANVVQYVPLSNRPEINVEFHISQNYPNPFNSSTQIQYYLPQLANVKLRVFDVLGREVATLVNGQMQSLGQHVVIWNGLNNAGIGVATGTYIYRIEAGEFRNEKKMVLVK